MHPFEIPYDFLNSLPLLCWSAVLSGSGPLSDEPIFDARKKKASVCSSQVIATTLFERSM
jgi:hypothetical protein